MLFFFKLDWHSIFEREKFADAVLICTPDRHHKVNIQCMCIYILYVTLDLYSSVHTPHYQPIKLVCVPQEPAVAFAKKGYHVLLEKPMAVSDL